MRVFRKAKVRAVILLILAAFPARALEVSIAPIVVIDEAGGAPGAAPPVERSLYGLLSERAFDGKVTVSLSGARRREAPRSLLEALKLADAEGHPYLVYGYLKRSAETLILELKLLDREARSVAAVFFAGDAADRYDRLLSDMDAKIAAYFQETLGAGPGKKADVPDRERAWSLPFSLGYWIPAASSGWNGALAGLIRARAGVRFRPRMPAYVKDSRKRQLGFGSDLEYALGISAPGMEESVLHSLLWRLSGEWGIELDDRREIGAVFGPFLRMDILSQSRKYSERITDLSACPGIGVEGYFAYRLNERVSLGAFLGLDAAFYADALITLSPGIRAEYRFISKEGGHGE